MRKRKIMKRHVLVLLTGAPPPAFLYFFPPIPPAPPELSRRNRRSRRLPPHFDFEGNNRSDRPDSLFFFKRPSRTYKDHRRKSSTIPSARISPLLRQFWVMLFGEEENKVPLLQVYKRRQSKFSKGSARDLAHPGYSESTNFQTSLATGPCIIKRRVRNIHGYSAMKKAENEESDARARTE